MEQGDEFGGGLEGVGRGKPLGSDTSRLPAVRVTRLTGGVNYQLTRCQTKGVTRYDMGDTLKGIFNRKEPAHGHDGIASGGVFLDDFRAYGDCSSVDALPAQSL